MIILASNSKARRKLLRNLGVRFKVVAPRVKEHYHASLAPRTVVKSNALLKAREVASRLRRGMVRLRPSAGSGLGPSIVEGLRSPLVVVGCDTVVAQGAEFFGKPKTLSEAHRMLRRLSLRPHRVYTGLAVIDAARKRELVDIEETKIVMEPLSEAEIRRYFKASSPLDKAGGFDIQGPGAFFIRRIEGCYFNVVGLPLAKLAKMLKKFGVRLLIFLCALQISGCATEYNIATNVEDRLMYSADQEVSVGDALSRQMEQNYTLVHDPELNERVGRVGAKIAEVCDRRELIYRFRIIVDEKDKDAVNAVALPGGYIYVFKNLLIVAASDDELAAVLGHEVGHIAAKHPVKRLQALWGYNILGLLGLVSGDADFAVGIQAAYLQLLMGYSQEDELAADRLGARYAQRAGYDPGAMLVFLDKLRQRHRKEKPQALSYFKTHPFIAERIRATKEELGASLSFKDFINTNY